MSSFRRIFRDRWFLFSTVVFATVACDQLSKWVARDLLKDRVHVFWGDLFRLQHAENPGAFLSMGSEMPEGVRVVVFAMAVVAVVGYALFSIWKNGDLNKYFLIAVSLVAGGGIGNLIDRLIKGTVTDFFNLGIGSLRTGIFNIADMAIVAGVTILVFVPSPQAKKNPPRVSGGSG